MLPVISVSRYFMSEVIASIAHDVDEAHNLRFGLKMGESRSKHNVCCAGLECGGGKCTGQSSCENLADATKLTVLGWCHIDR